MWLVLSGDSWLNRPRRENVGSWALDWYFWRKKAGLESKSCEQALSLLLLKFSSHGSQRLPCSVCWLTSLCNCLGWRPSVKCSSWGNFSLSALPGHRAAAPQGRCSPWGGQREVVEDKSCCLSVSPGEGKAVCWRKSLSTALLQLHWPSSSLGRQTAAASQTKLAPSISLAVLLCFQVHAFCLSASPCVFGGPVSFEVTPSWCEFLGAEVSLLF